MGKSVKRGETRLTGVCVNLYIDCLGVLGRIIRQMHICMMRFSIPRVKKDSLLTFAGNISVRNQELEPRVQSSKVDQLIAELSAARFGRTAGTESTLSRWLAWFSQNTIEVRLTREKIRQSNPQQTSACTALVGERKMEEAESSAMTISPAIGTASFFLHLLYLPRLHYELPQTTKKQ